MSDKTFGVKVSEELHDRVKQMIDLSGVSAKEWFEKAVALSEVRNLKEGAQDYQSDLNELEVHTTRIYQLVANMVQRANYIKDDAIKNLIEKIDSKDITISDLQNNLKELEVELNQVKEEAKQSEEAKDIFFKQVDELRNTNENSQALIAEYKEKIDTLSSLVNKYKDYAKENSRLKTEYAAEKNELEKTYHDKLVRADSAIEELKQTNQGHLNELEKLGKALEGQKVNYENQLTELTEKVEAQSKENEEKLQHLAERKSLEKDRAILDVERKYQEKLEKARESYNIKLAEMYERLTNAEEAQIQDDKE